MTSLLDPTRGVAAEDVARQVGLSPVDRVEALERRCAVLERTLCGVLEIFRGLDLNGGQAFVTPEPGAGMIRMWSPDGSVTISDAPTGEAHSVGLVVTSPGCVNAVSSLCHDDGVVVSMNGCGQHTIIGEDSVVPVRAYTQGDGANKETDIRVEGESYPNPPDADRYVPLRKISGGWTFLISTDTPPVGWVAPSETYTGSC